MTRTTHVLTRDSFASAVLSKERGDVTPTPDPNWPTEWSIEEPSTDGRLARGQRTRRNVAEALVELLREGDPDPTAKAIAERAGVSLRLVFHHFADIDDLYQAVGTLQLERHWSDLPTLGAQLPLSARIERTVRHRSILFEEISPVRRAAVRRGGSSPHISDAVAYTDGLLLENLRTNFDPELRLKSEETRVYVLNALDAAASWEMWDRMRRHSDLPVASARRIMTHMVHAVLVSEPPAIVVEH
jgi:AcrR family transcriptional regulator